MSPSDVVDGARSRQRVTRSVRVLVALFMVAQFAGVVSSPLAGAHVAPSAVTTHADHQHTHHHGHGARAHQNSEQCGDHGDHCCALHAFFAGILPPVIVVANVDTFGERLMPPGTDVSLGVDPARLDRPPRPFAAL
jgi:hypothetical protein